MSQMSLRRTIWHLGPLQIAIIILALATALVHLDRGFTMSMLSGAGHFAGAGHLPTGGHFRGSAGGPPAGSAGGRPGGAGILSFIPIPLNILFYLNFVGYVVLITALYLPPLQNYQHLIRWALIIYTIITILAWFLIAHAQPNLLAYGDKVMEVALIALLLIEEWQASKADRHANMTRS